MRFSEAKGHKVVSTGDATTVGRVDRLVVDPTTARVVALHLKKTPGDGDVLAWSDVVGFGPDAVTVASADVFTKESGKPVDLVGARVLEETGDELGEVKDVDFDPTDGTVRALLTKGGEVAGDRMMGLGSYALVVCRA